MGVIRSIVIGVLVGVSASIASSAFAQTKSQIDGDFEGCDFNKVYPLLNGLILVCQEYNHSYSYMPEVVVIDGSRVR